MRATTKRSLVAVALVGGVSLGLALLSSRVGPPREVRLTVRAAPGLAGEAQVARGSRGPLPFSIELALRVEPEHDGAMQDYLTHVLPGSDGVLMDGLEPGDASGPAIWWVSGAADGLTVETGFEIEAWTADGAALVPMKLLESEEPGVARTIVVGQRDDG